MPSTKKILMDIPMSRIDRNPENPRLFFRQQEMDELTESIRRFGVQVPISVYEESGQFILLDGERRWRCSLKLNKKTIPGIVQEKPDAFTNLVLMFNIHALREQWDLLTLALKLPRVIKLYKDKYGEEPKENALAEETGLTRSTIRRCKLLMNLPDHHKDIIRAELKKPKSEQRITEDFYIEMERSLTTASRSMPDIIPDDEKREKVRQILLDKYRTGVINNIVDFRKIAKIARAENVDADTEKASHELQKLFQDNTYSIQSAYERSVSGAYTERDLQTHITSLIEDLELVRSKPIDPNVFDLLEKLVNTAQEILKDRL